MNENYIIYIFLDYLLSDLSDHGRVVNINCVSQRWFHSPDGVNYTVLNSSSSKYMIANDNNNLLRIHFSNVSASDEGIYGCLDGTNDRIQSYVGCLKVYGESCYRSTRVLYHKGLYAPGPAMHVTPYNMQIQGSIIIKYYNYYSLLHRCNSICF